MELLFNFLLKLRFIILHLLKPIHKRAWLDKSENDGWIEIPYYFERFDEPEFWMKGRPGFELKYYPEGWHYFRVNPEDKRITTEVCSLFDFRYAKLDLTFEILAGDEGVKFAFWVLSDPDLPEWDFEIMNGRLSVAHHWGWKYKKGCKKVSKWNLIPFVNFYGHEYTLSLEISPYAVRWLVNGILVKRSRITSGGRKRVVISAYCEDGVSSGLMKVNNLTVYKNTKDQ